MSDKYNTLFVFEGVKTEDNIVAKMEKYFTGMLLAVKCVFGSEIYQLYKRLKEEDFSVDIVSLLKERSEKNRKELDGYDNDSFSYIYFFFDYDAHATKADDNKIAELIDFFDNETENGKIFISYPMVEAIKHYKDKQTFKDLIVKCKGQNCPSIDSCEKKEQCLREPHYKTTIPTYSLGKYQNLNSSDVWKELIDANICKSNYIVNDNYTRPTDIISQKDIFEKQQAKHISQDCPLVSVLSAFPLFLQDFYGVETLNSKL